MRSFDLSKLPPRVFSTGDRRCKTCRNNYKAAYRKAGGAH